jgi:hypothetical protein
MPKSEYAKAVDEIQRSFRSYLRDNGFGMRGRTFNRTTEDSLTQVINVMMGPSDPPGTRHAPGLTMNYHGLFTVNLGVYVPEVAKIQCGSEARSWVQDSRCCIRLGLLEASGVTTRSWWRAEYDDTIIDDVVACLHQYGLPFLDRFSSRDKILREWNGKSENLPEGCTPRIVLAIILAERGKIDAARELLAKQVLETLHPGHPAYVRQLAMDLGLGDLAC